MPGYSQEERPLILTTPLGKDVLLVTSFRGHESISQLFGFEIEMLAELGTKIPFDQILGQTVTLEMRLMNGDKRYFNALVKQFTQGRRDEVFVSYRASLTPKLWLLTKKVRSRIFQHVTVPDILNTVITGMDVTYELSATYFPRDYCVQYGESDFDFVSRLMEEEGIYYFFKHSDGSHQMVVTDLPSKHPTVPGQSRVIYEELIGEDRTDMRVTGWDKTQTIRAGEFTAWDYCFELPDKNLQGIEKTIPSVTVGKVTHKLNVGHNDQLEIYQYPGGYAQRFDGINHAGAPQPQDLNNIFPDRARTVRIRMEQEEVQSIDIQGTSDCGQFTAGHEFTLERHFDADDKYLLTRVEHAAKQEHYRSQQAERPFTYENRFSCIPDGLCYRPQQTIPKPVIAGLQTAVVTGPPGEEIFVDKYGRVKVQFHWDREGKKNADSSCWLRVAQVWAGKRWGAFFWPRIGHEVVVSFEEGDPDKPLIIGSVYNHDNMPWYSLPKNKQLAGFKSASVSGTAHQNFNGLVFNDEKGKEHLSIHSENNLSLNSEKNKMIHAGASKGERVGIANILTVGKIIPATGGSGGGFDGGNTMNDPPPLAIMGMNAMVTYGDQFQCASPVNHQITIGQNVQMCISLGALVAEAINYFGGPSGFAPISAAVLGSAMGSMQFTVGSSAQFTLGQTFEISVGPPKVELHKAHCTKFDVVRLLCILLGLLSEVFSITYDHLKGGNNANSSDEYGAPATSDEQSGDQERAIFILIYQGITDVMLVAIMLAEYLTDTVDWIGCDTARAAYVADHPLGLWKGSPKLGFSDSWSGAGQLGVGLIGVTLMVLAELTDLPVIGDKADTQ
jgi:type VI secretion system secreted protein VgrG